MAEKSFFDLLKAKMAALRPSAQHLEDDWAALTQRLDQTMPPQSREPRRLWAPLLLLLLTLLASNALWWQQNRENHLAMQRLETRLAGLQATIVSLKPAPPIIRTDTVWQTVYVRVPGQETPSRPYTLHTNPGTTDDDLPVYPESVQKATFNQTNNAQLVDQESFTDTPNKHKAASNGGDRALSKSPDIADDEVPVISVVDILGKTNPATLEMTPNKEVFSPGLVIASSARKHIPVRPFGPVLLNALKPKYIKVGAIAAWLNPLNSALKHEIGFETGIHANVGFSRHWSLVLEYTFGQLHYESNDPNAILGSPEFPHLPSAAYRFEHLDLQRQPVWQFGMGLRYTFLQPGKVRPYIGLQWGGQTVRPYRVEYEIRHEPSNTSETAVLNVENSTYLPNTLRFGAGIEMPLFERLHFTAEGSYLGQWKKQNRGAFGMVGLRIGTNWLF